jgi:hypothetical protein
MSTLEERVDFIKAIGRRNIEDVLDATEPMPMVQETEVTRSVMAREPAKPANAPEKLETQNTERGRDCELDPRFQKEVHRTTPEIVPEHVGGNADPREENYVERWFRHWKERERQRRDRERKEAQEAWESETRERYRQAGWPFGP